MAVPSNVWTERELDEVILELCEEFPRASLASYWRALEYGRTRAPVGSRESLVAAMRERLQTDAAMRRSTRRGPPHRGCSRASAASAG